MSAASDPALSEATNTVKEDTGNHETASRSKADDKKKVKADVRSLLSFVSDRALLGFSSQRYICVPSRCDHAYLPARYPIPPYPAVLQSLWDLELPEMQCSILLRGSQGWADCWCPDIRLHVPPLSLTTSLGPCCVTALVPTNSVTLHCHDISRFKLHHVPSANPWVFSSSIAAIYNNGQRLCMQVLYIQGRSLM